jgi:site-specific recombinase XerD
MVNHPFLFPIPIIDTIEAIKDKKQCQKNIANRKDYRLTLAFLSIYNGNNATFESYRRELERLLQWAWLTAQKSILTLTREDIETYIQFCMKPPKQWIGKKRVARYLLHEGVRVPNPAWRPFVAKVSKSKVKQGKRARVSSYRMSQNSVRALFAILSRFYEYLVFEEKIQRNPVAAIRQKSRYLQKHQQQTQIIRLSDDQWRACLKAVKRMAKKNPRLHARTRFIVIAMYLMYLRISEFVATERWTPTMNHFYRDSDQQWWFKILGKGNKLRTIAVSDAMLEAFKQYRESLGLDPLPSPADASPLIPKTRGAGAMQSVRQIRRVIQSCFDQAVLVLRKKEKVEEADALETATVHWLRHTGISDDVNKRGRPIAHVRDDAGHASIVTTGAYSDVELKDRHQSAKRKTTRIKKTLTKSEEQRKT